MGKSLLIAAVVFMFVGGFAVTKHNQATRMKEKINSYELELANVHDNTWKTVKDQVGIVNMSREDYDKYLKAYVDGREAVGTDKALMVWLQDNATQNPQQLYDKLMSTVRESRRNMMEANKLCNHVTTEYNAYIKTFPTNMLWWHRPIEIKQITSDKSREALETGTDNELLIP